MKLCYFQKYYGVLRDILKSEDKSCYGNPFGGVQAGWGNENQGQI